MALAALTGRRPECRATVPRGSVDQGGRSDKDNDRRKNSGYTKNVKVASPKLNDESKDGANDS